MVSILTFLFSQYAGEGCPVDHGPKFKKVERSWVCAFMLNISYVHALLECNYCIFPFSPPRFKFNCILKFSSNVIKNP